MLYYVYTHTRTGDSNPFYVGKGYGNRAISEKGRSLFWKRYAKNGYTVEYEYENLDEATALQMEKDLITMWGRIDTGTGCLVNLTDGGEGMSGYRHTDETKSRIRAKRAIQKNVGKGVPKNPETVERMRTAKTGTKYSEEHRSNMSKAAKGKSKSDAHRLSIKLSWVKRKQQSRHKAGILEE